MAASTRKEIPARWRGRRYLNETGATKFELQDRQAHGIVMNTLNEILASTYQSS